jgi:hypothetical protein
MNKKLAGLIAIVFGLAAATAQAVSLTGGTYSENFDSMGAAGTTAPTGWTVDSTPNPAPGTGVTDSPVNTGAVSATTTVVAGTGSSANGGNYNFGVAATNVVGERALGSLASAGNQRDSYVSFANNTGFTITQFSVSYDGEQWRLGDTTTAVNVLTLQYSATGLSGSWVALGSGFNFTSPITTGTTGALDGNAAANRVANIGGTYTPGANIANGSSFYLRWADPDDGGFDNGMAIDNFSITVVPEPSTWFAAGLTLVGLLSSQRRRLARLVRR